MHTERAAKEPATEKTTRAVIFKTKTKPSGRHENMSFIEMFHRIFFYT